MLLISNKINSKLKALLKEKNLDYLTTLNNNNLDSRIADHPDLSVFKTENKLFVDKNLFNYYKEKVGHLEIIASSSVKNAYPYDSIFNIVETRNYFIHNNYTESEIEKFLSKTKKKISVKQGYSRCSIIKFPKDIFLTNDYGIYKKTKDKINITLLKPENVYLDGFDNGFLGGTMGIIDKNTVIFSGNIESLNSYDIIKKIAEDNNIRLLYPKDKLVDLGSIINLDWLKIRRINEYH